MTDLERLAMELKQRTEWQDVPVQLTEADYQEIVRQATRHLYVMTGRSEQYSDENAVTLNADEYEYALTTAELSFYRKVQSDVNRIVGYSTDAMSITNADKPYSNTAWVSACASMSFRALEM